MNHPLRIALLMLTLAASAWAQQPPGSAEPKPVPPPSIREVSPGVFQVGGVKLEREARRVSFPAKLNMTNGPIEYLLVTTAGKAHESLLTTDIEPQHLQVAMLLLGAKGMQATPLTNAPAGGPITQVQGERNPPLPGEPVLGPMVMSAPSVLLRTMSPSRVKTALTPVVVVLALTPATSSEALA